MLVKSLDWFLFFGNIYLVIMVIIGLVEISPKVAEKEKEMNNDQRCFRFLCECAEKSIQEIIESKSYACSQSELFAEVISAKSNIPDMMESGIRTAFRYVSQDIAKRSGDFETINIDGFEVISLPEIKFSGMATELVSRAEERGVSLSLLIAELSSAELNINTSVLIFKDDGHPLFIERVAKISKARSLFPLSVEEALVVRVKYSNHTLQSQWGLKKVVGQLLDHPKWFSIAAIEHHANLEIFSRFPGYYWEGEGASYPMGIAFSSPS